MPRLYNNDYNEEWEKRIREPRFTVELSLDDANVDLVYLTSHADGVGGGGGSNVVITFDAGGTRVPVVDDEAWEGFGGTAKGKIVSINVTSGSWAGNDAAGTIEVEMISGAFSATGPATLQLWTGTTADENFATLQSSAAASSAILDVLRNLSDSSFGVDIKKASSSIGGFTFDVIDEDNAISDILNTNLLVAVEGMRNKRVRLYAGFKDLAWGDYVLRSTTIIESISDKDNNLKFVCKDPGLFAKREIMVADKTYLAESITPTSLVIKTNATLADSTTKFLWCEHDSGYVADPSMTQVAYVKLEDEVIRCVKDVTGNNSGALYDTGGGVYGFKVDGVDGRGVFGTEAVDHVYDDDETNAERQHEIDEFVFLNGDGPTLAYAILTGEDLAGNPIPAGWSAGISTAFVEKDDFDDIGEDLHDPSANSAGRRLLFEGIGKSDAKQFIEKEILTFLGCFWVVHADGKIGIKRLTPIASSGGYTHTLGIDSITRYSDLKHNMDEVVSDYQIEWDWAFDREKFRRATRVVDSVSQSIHGGTPAQRWKFLGLHTLGTVETDIHVLVDMWRDRYSSPPQTIQINAFAADTIECGDLVKVTLPQVTDYIDNTSLDRVFEVHKVVTNYLTGEVKLSLFGSLGVSAVALRSSLATIMDDAWYLDQGTNLTTPLTISGDAVTANGSLSAGDYYYDGPLTINAGVTVTINGTVRLFIKGAFTVNGDIDGEGNGPAGGVGQTTDPWPGNWTYGSFGAFGATCAQGGFYRRYTQIHEDKHTGPYAWTWNRRIIASPVKLPIPVRNAGGQLNAVNLRVTDDDDDGDGDNLFGLPTAMTGNSGPGGYAAHYAPDKDDLRGAAGNGGAGGAGLVVVSRGGGFGPSGQINLSGIAGAAGTEYVDAIGDNNWFGGSGGSGFPGACLWVQDGDFTTPSTGDLQANVTATRPAILIDYNLAVKNFQNYDGNGRVLENVRVSTSSFVASMDIWSPSYGFPQSFVAVADEEHHRNMARVQQLTPISDPRVSDPEGTAYQIGTPGAAPTVAKSGVIPPSVDAEGNVVYTLNVSWPVTGDTTASGYEVQARVEGGSYETIATIGSTDTISTNALTGIAGVTYEVRYRILSAINASSHSDYSAAQTFLVEHEVQVLFTQQQEIPVTDGDASQMSNNGANAIVGDAVTGTGHAEVWINNNGFEQSGSDIESTSVNDVAFGTAVAITNNGSRILVTDPADTTNSPLGGYVEFFTRDSGGGAWTSEDTDTGAANDELGIAAAMDGSGDTAIVGAWEGAANDGHVRIYDRSGAVWTPTTLTVASSSEELGTVVAISEDGTTAIASGLKQDSARGIVRVYRIDNLSWGQVDTIASVDLTAILNADDEFGEAIAITDDGSLIAASSLFRGAVWTLAENATSKIEEDVGNGIFASGFEDEVTAMTTDFDGKSETNMTIDVGTEAYSGIVGGDFLATAASAGGFITKDYTAVDRASLRFYFKLETGYAQSGDTRLATFRNPSNTRLVSLLLVDDGGGDWKLTLEDEVNVVATANSVIFTIDGFWHYCELTFANDSSDDEMRAYLDGTQFGVYVTTGSSDQVDRFDIGSVDTTTIADTSQFYIDDVRLHTIGPIGAVSLVGWDEEDVISKEAGRTAWWGTSIAFDSTGTIMAVGDPRYDGDFLRSGGVDIYRKNVDGTWTFVQLIEPDNPATDGRFGQTVSFGTDRLFVGTDGGDTFYFLS